MGIFDKEDRTLRCVGLKRIEKNTVVRVLNANIKI